MAADLRVTLDADAAKLERELARASRAMLGLDASIARTTSSSQQLDKIFADQRARQMQALGRGMTAFGLAAAAGLGLATKAAIEWESAWAGVRKTVEGSPEELAALEKELRGLTRTLPASHKEIAAVAEAAGQLGVARQDISSFTSVMIMLGETTNLSADQAATSIAQLMNVMQTAPQNVGRLGAALVELGNNGASTEADIITLAARIAGAGAQIGLSEAEVLGFANAIASVGIDAEAGGSAISRVMIEISKSVQSGGDAVETFAKVAGVSASAFSAAFRDDPAAAIDLFVTGLGKISAEGGNVFAVLEDLGLGEIRVRDALLRLSGAGDLLTQSLADGTRAWEENTALVEEAEKRFDTAEAKIGLARNALVDLAIDVGNVVLPAVAELGETAASIAHWFADLPGPVKTVATVLGVLASGAALAGGAFLLLAPRIQAARDLFLDFARSNRVAAGAMITAGQAAAVASGMLMIAAAMEAAYQASLDTATGVGAMTDALLKLRRGETTDAIDNLIEKRDALAERNIWLDIGLSMTNFSGGMTGTRKAADELAAELESVDKALASLVQSGETEAAEEAARALAEAWVASGGSADALRERLPLYADALKAVSAEQEIAADTAGPVQDSLVSLAGAFELAGDDAAAAAQEMLDSWSEAAGGFIDFTAAYDTALAAKEESERETAQATADATTSGSDSWEDFIGDVTLTVDEYLEELERQIQAQKDWETNLLLIAGRVPEKFLSYLVELGPGAADQIALMAQMTNEELAIATEAWSLSAGEGADSIVNRLAEAAPVLAFVARTMGEDVAMKIRDGMIANNTDVYTAAQALGITIDKGVGVDKVRYVPVSPRVAEGSIADVNRKINSALTARYIDVHFRFREPSGGAGGFFPDAGGRGFTPGFPLPGGAGAYRITQGPHDGGALDYAASPGTPVYASFPGYLDLTDLGSRSYGRYYTLRGSGNYELGAHLSRFARGDGFASPGSLIGWTGSTGNSTGPHLHLLRRFGSFHSGGEVGGAGDEVLAVLQTRERVLSRGQNAAFTAFLRSMRAVSATPAGGGGAGPVNALIQVSPWDARVPGLRDVMVAAARQVIADFRAEMAMSMARGGPA